MIVATAILMGLIAGFGIACVWLSDFSDNGRPLPETPPERMENHNRIIAFERKVETVRDDMEAVIGLTGEEV